MKNTKKVSYDIRARLTAEAERDAAIDRIAQLEAKLASAVAAPAPAPAQPAAPSVLAQLRALPKESAARTAFALQNATAIAAEVDLERKGAA